jgi:hypothetical protein
MRFPFGLLRDAREARRPVMRETEAERWARIRDAHRKASNHPSREG